MASRFLPSTDMEAALCVCARDHTAKPMCARIKDHNRLFRRARVYRYLAYWVLYVSAQAERIWRPHCARLSQLMRCNVSWRDRSRSLVALRAKGIAWTGSKAKGGLGWRGDLFSFFYPSSTMAKRLVECVSDGAATAWHATAIEQDAHLASRQGANQRVAYCAFDIDSVDRRDDQRRCLKTYAPPMSLCRCDHARILYLALTVSSIVVRRA